MQNGSLKRSTPTVKKLNFKNPRWRTAAILKTVKPTYLCNRLTDFDEIWHILVPSAWRKVQFFNFRQSFTTESPYLKNRKAA